MNSNKQKSKTRDIAYMGMALALVIVGSRITIPTQPIPISMQTFTVILVAMLLGAKRSALVQSAYMILGLIGLPIFTGGGGIDYVLRPSFGYILGFIAAAFVTGTLFDWVRTKIKHGQNTLGIWTSAMFSGMAGLIVIYSIGVLYLFFVSRFYLGSDKGLLHFINVGAWIFVPKDVLSVFLSTVAASTLFKLIPQLRQGRRPKSNPAIDHKN